MRATHSYTDGTATIRIQGLRAPVRMLHLTDSHLHLFDERDGERVEACVDFCGRFTQELKEAGVEVAPDETFRRQLARAATEDLDLLALTGDTMHFPSPASVDFVVREAAALGVPMMYTCGNHDVHYTDERVNAAVRLTRLPALKPLHPYDPDFEAREIGGIRFVSVDSAVPQISARQLDFVRSQLQDGVPTVLLTHWPLSLPTLREPAISSLGAPVLIGDPDWSIESRIEWQVSEDTPETLEFVRLVTTAPNLAGVFCGHVHFAHADAINTRAVQYVAAPGCRGGHRLVRFEPL